MPVNTVHKRIILYHILIVIISHTDSIINHGHGYNDAFLHDTIDMIEYLSS